MRFFVSPGLLSKKELENPIDGFLYFTMRLKRLFGLVSEEEREKKDSFPSVSEATGPLLNLETTMETENWTSLRIKITI